MWKTEGKRTPRKPSSRWKDNVKMDLQEMGDVSGLDRCGLGYGQVAGFCECSNETSVSI